MSEYHQQIEILIIDDEEIICESLSDFLQKMGHSVQCCNCAEEAIEITKNKEFDVIFIDIRLPKMDGITLLKKFNDLPFNPSIIIITGHGTMDMAIQALRLGASDFLKKPIKFYDLEAALERSLRLLRFSHEKIRLKATIDAICARSISDFIIGESKAIIELRENIKLAANSKVKNIIILGETGTGKEVAARALHNLSYGHLSPFFALNCPAIPESLMESELFGHHKGAFTGAVSDRLGAFELAHGGTLFLDEISDLNLNTQAKLLRVLETRSFRRVGSSRERNVDVSVIAASNSNLIKLMEKGKFRSDLYFRLNIFHIEIPPLRERKADIIPLSNHFLINFCKSKKINVKLSLKAKEKLYNYHFPGNVRELKNIIERAIILSDGANILKEHIIILSDHNETIACNIKNNTLPKEGQAILDVLKKNRWNRIKSAKELNISYEKLRWLIKKYNLTI
ncbi:MAG: sigma-54-dependent Fis family transcriptional regulator [Desulfobacterales bacterium]|nr:sigma-54-dependent Fis family transcriptional regulator [Desulfobacterales bacterium]